LIFLNQRSRIAGESVKNQDSSSEVKIGYPKKFHYGWFMVAVSWIMIFFTGSVAPSIFFKPMLEDFGWDRITLSSVQSVAMVFVMVASPFLGRLVDRFGPKVMIIGVTVSQILSRGIQGFAANIWHLYLGRFLFGVNVGPATQALLNKWFVKKRGIALGIAATGMAAGTIVLTPISQYLILLWGWRLTMLFWTVVAFFVMLPLALFIKDSPEDKGFGPDGEPLGKTRPIKQAIETEDTAFQSDVTLQEGSSISGAMKTRSFWFLTTGHIICGIGCGFMATHIIAFVTDVGYSAMIGASLVSLQGGLNLIGVLVTGTLSDKIARKNVLALTHFARSMSFGIIIIFILLGSDSLWLLYLAMALFGFGWYTTAPLTAGLVADLFGNLRMGTLLGVIMSCHMLGVAIGAFAGGAIFEATKNYYLFFLIQGPLEFVAVIWALLIKREKQNVDYLA